MDDQIFSDGIGAITAIGGTVRLDLVNFSPTEKDAKGQPALVFRQRVIMSTEAFLMAADKIHEVAGALAKSGMRPRAEAPAAERAAQPIPAEKSVAQTPPPSPPGTPFP